MFSLTFLEKGWNNLLVAFESNAHLKFCKICHWPKNRAPSSPEIAENANIRQIVKISQGEYNDSFLFCYTFFLTRFLNAFTQF